MTTEKIKYPLKNKLIVLVLVAMVPILYIAIYLIVALLDYSRAYDQIVSSMMLANNYNMYFKDEMDESLYKLVVSNITFDTIEEDGTLRDPYKLIGELRTESENLLTMTADQESRVWLQSLLRNVDTLEDRVNDIRANQEAEGQYEKNIDMLYNDIYILTELVQDDIQHYIYYQTKSIEHLKTQLNQEVERVIIISVLLGGCIVVVVILTASAILNSITRPIQELCRITSQIAEEISRTAPGCRRRMSWRCCRTASMTCLKILKSWSIRSRRTSARCAARSCGFCRNRSTRIFYITHSTRSSG